MSDVTDDLMEELEMRWDELEPRTGQSDEHEQDSPAAGPPSATTSGGEADSVTGD